MKIFPITINIQVLSTRRQTSHHLGNLVRAIHSLNQRGLSRVPPPHKFLHSQRHVIQVIKLNIFMNKKLEIKIRRIISNN